AGDLVERQHDIDAPGLDGRLGHAEVLGGRAVLGQGDAAGRLDGLQAVGAVPAATGQDDPDGAVAQARRHRLEQPIGGGAHEMYPDRVGQGKGAVGVDEEVPVGRRDVHDAGSEAVAVLGLLDGQVDVSAEDLGHQAGAVRVEVLDQDDRRGEVARQG